MRWQHAAHTRAGREALRTSRIARKLTPEQAREARVFTFALLDPLIDISGKPIGCADPDDDHILELAMNASVRFIVARDGAILNLAPPVRKLLDDHGVTVMRDDVLWLHARIVLPQRISHRIADDVEVTSDVSADGNSAAFRKRS